MIVVAQIEALGVNGVAVAQGGQAIGFRGVPLLPEAGVFDGKLPIVTLRELGPHDPDNRFHHVSFDVPVTASAVRRFLHLETYNENAPFVNDFAEGEAATVHLHWYVDEGTVFARYTATVPIDLMLLGNGALSPADVRSVDRESATLRQSSFEVVLQVCGDVRGFCAAAHAEEAETRLRGHVLPAKECAVTAHRLTLSPTAPVYVALGVGHVVLSPEAVDRALVDGASAMARDQATSDGAAADCADAIQRLVGYCTCFDPRDGRRYVSVNRDWALPNSQPPPFMWDNVFNAYMAIWSDPELGKQSLAHLLDMIENDGMLGAPPQRNLIVPVIYSKLVRSLGERDFARKSFPTMMKFVRFWFEDRGDGHPRRDGNDDGLIECGAHRQPGDIPLARIIQDAFDETGYDDSPMYSDGFAYQRVGIPAEGVKYLFARGTLNLTMIGQNSLYVASCRAMAVVAEWLGEAHERAWLLGEADRVAARIRERLFDTSRGYYMNRFFDDAFSTVKAMTIFYPLMIDVCDEPCRAALRSTLLDPRQFWGDNVIPTVSRDDPAYEGDPWRSEYWRGNYWRGNVWPSTNYIVYLALRQTDWHDVTDDFTRKSTRLFMDDWRPRHHAMENYPPEGHTPTTQVYHANGGRNPHYIWAGLLPMMALEQLFSVEDTSPGVRFGTLDEATFGSWSNFWFVGRRCSIRAGADGVNLAIPEVLSFSSNRPIQIRHFDLATGAFAYWCNEPVEIQMRVNAVRRTVRLCTAPHGAEYGGGC